MIPSAAHRIELLNIKIPTKKSAEPTLHRTIFSPSNFRYPLFVILFPPFFQSKTCPEPFDRVYPERSRRAQDKLRRRIKNLKLLSYCPFPPEADQPFFVAEPFSI
jgi:hypothetical protein